MTRHLAIWILANAVAGCTTTARLAVAPYALPGLAARGSVRYALPSGEEHEGDLYRVDVRTRSGELAFLWAPIKARVEGDADLAKLIVSTRRGGFPGSAGPFEQELRIRDIQSLDATYLVRGQSSTAGIVLLALGGAIIAGGIVGGAIGSANCCNGSADEGAFAGVPFIIGGTVAGVVGLPILIAGIVVSSKSEEVRPIVSTVPRFVIGRDGAGLAF